MRKRISILLIFCMLISLLCGCSKIYNNQPETEAAKNIEPIKKTAETRESLVEGMELYPIYDDIRVHYIDVGQGDCEFIELPNGQTMLIDAGNSHNGSEIVRYIKNIFEYDEIDYVVATHPHSDHIGGMAEVLNSFDVGTMYMPEKSHTSKTFENLLDVIENKNINLHRAKANTNILTSGLLTIDILAPIDDGYSNLNNYSAVVKLVYGETVFLFTGDAEREVENKLLSSDIDADVLKVGHHGSNTASTSAFIKKVTPKVSVISCGTGNQYGHPHSETLAVLNDNNSQIYRTDEVGTVIVTADSKKKISVDKKASVIKENAPPVYVEKEQETIEQNVNAGVFKTNSGECYHLNGCSSLSRSKIATTINEAKDEGLRPCKRCQPPG